jgi:uncharacterized membrane protein YgcG
MKILIVFILVSFCQSQKTQKWKVEELVKAYNASSNKQVIDPNDYLDNNSLDEKTLTLINTLEAEKKITTRIFIISGISDEYKSFFSTDIEKYVNDLSFEILKGNKEDELDSIFILFSINDRIMRIRTGANVRAYLPDSKAKDYLDSLKSYLRSGKYSTAINYLMDCIHTRITSPYTILWDILEYLLIIVIVGSIIMYYIYLCLSKRISQPASSRLDKIQQICQKAKPKREVIETTCVICLEEFCNKPLDVLYENVNKNSLKEKLDKADPTSVAKIECGHSFHYGCIAEWMKNHNTCPTCREKIDIEEDGRMLSENLVAVQTTLFPDITRAMITHGVAFRWNNNYFSSSGSSSASRGGWNFGSGGASSRW